MIPGVHLCVHMLQFDLSVICNRIHPIWHKIKLTEIVMLNNWEMDKKKRASVGLNKQRRNF